MKSMNELKVAEEIISDMGVVSDTPYKEIMLLAKYYREMGYNKKDTQNLIIELLEKKMDKFLKAQWDEEIEKKVKKVFKDEMELIKIESIYITEREVETLNSLEDRNERRLLFTLMVLSRFNNLQRKNTYNRTYEKSSEVKKLSNIRNLNKEKMCSVYHSLRVKGLIDFFGRGQEEDNIIVKCLEEDSEVAFQITKLENFGNLIEDELKIKYDKTYKRCGVCGKAVKIKGRNTKYCTECSLDKERERDREKKSKKRSKK